MANLTLEKPPSSHTSVHCMVWRMAKCRVIFQFVSIFIEYCVISDMTVSKLKSVLSASSCVFVPVDDPTKDLLTEISEVSFLSKPELNPTRFNVINLIKVQSHFELSLAKLSPRLLSPLCDKNVYFRLSTTGEGWRQTAQDLHYHLRIPLGCLLPLPKSSSTHQGNSIATIINNNNNDNSNNNNKMSAFTNPILTKL